MINPTSAIHCVRVSKREWVIIFRLMLFDIHLMGQKLSKSNFCLQLEPIMHALPKMRLTKDYSLLNKYINDELRRCLFAEFCRSEGHASCVLEKAF